MATPQHIKDAKDRLKKYEDKLGELFESSLDEVSLDNKRIDVALKQQIYLEMQFEVIHKKIKRVYAEFEHLVEESYSDAISTVLRDGYKATSITEAKEIARTDPTYRAVKRVSVEAKSLLDEASGLQDVVHSRRYTLNNLTQVIVAEVKETIL